MCGGGGVFPNIVCQASGAAAISATRAESSGENMFFPRHPAQLFAGSGCLCIMLNVQVKIEILPPLCWGVIRLSAQQSPCLSWGDLSHGLGFSPPLGYRCRGIVHARGPVME